MKMVFAVAALLTSNLAFAGTGVLDGKSYCRAVTSDGLFGQPKGTFNHCIRFSDGVATDNADSFFGNPPKSADYNVVGNAVVFGESTYTVSNDGTSLTTVKGSATSGIVLTLQK